MAYGSKRYGTGPYGGGPAAALSPLPITGVGIPSDETIGVGQIAVLTGVGIATAEAFGRGALMDVGSARVAYAHEDENIGFPFIVVRDGTGYEDENIGASFYEEVVVGEIRADSRVRRSMMGYAHEDENVVDHFCPPLAAIGSASGTSASSGTCSLTAPAGIVAGQLLLLCVTMQHNIGVTMPNAEATAPGFTFLAGYYGANGAKITLLYKTAAGTESGSTITATGPAGNLNMVAELIHLPLAIGGGSHASGWLDGPPVSSPYLDVAAQTGTSGSPLLQVIFVSMDTQSGSTPTQPDHADVCTVVTIDGESFRNGLRSTVVCNVGATAAAKSFQPQTGTYRFSISLLVPYSGCA